jgi:riboflavin synthase
MFTGIVECMGEVVSFGGDAVRTLVVHSSLPHASIATGDSIAVEGCCLTVVRNEGNTLSFDVSAETLKRTTLGQLQQGRRVNLERALQVGGHLGGHWVSGHVDGVASVVSAHQEGSGWYITLQVPEEVARLSVPRGCIIVSGVALTITHVQKLHVQVCVIPHTLQVTTLGAVVAEAQKHPSYASFPLLNVEADLMARYVQGLLVQMSPLPTVPA